MAWQEFGPRSEIVESSDVSFTGGFVLEPDDRWKYMETYGGIKEALKALESGVIAALNSVRINEASGGVELRTKGQHLLGNLTRLGIQGRCLFWDSADGAEQRIHEQVRGLIAQGGLDPLMETSAIAWGKVFAVFDPQRFDPNNQRLPNPRANFPLAQWQGDRHCNGIEDGVEWYGQEETVLVPRVGVALGSDNNILVVRAPKRFIVSSGPKGQLLTSEKGVQVLRTSNKPKEAGIDLVQEAQGFAELTADPDVMLTTNSSVVIWLFPNDGSQPLRVTVTTFLPVGQVDWPGVIKKLGCLSEEEQIKIRNIPGGLAFVDILRPYAESLLSFPGHFKAYEDTVFCFRTLWPPALSAALGDKTAEQILRQTHNLAIYRDKKRNEVKVYLQDTSLSTHWR